MKTLLLALLIAVPSAVAQDEPESSEPAASGTSLGGAGIGQGAADAAPKAADAATKPEPADSQPCADSSSSAAGRLKIAATVLPGAFPGALPKIAYDCVNRVYLSVVGAPVKGRFWSKDGKPLGGEFAIALDETGYNGWATVAFGGPAGDAAFLVAYVDAASQTQYGRLIRYAGGRRVGARSRIADVNGEWYASEKARSVWDGRRFIVGTRVKPAGARFPYPQLHHFDMEGKVADERKLGDGLDYEGSPAIACAPGGTCLAVGYADKGTYARLFDARTLAPLGALFYLDDHSGRNEDQNVVFNARAGRFVTAWARGGYVDTRVVSLGGVPGPLDTRKSFGPGAGDVALSYNASAGTALLVTKWSPPPLNAGADLYALLLGDDGAPVDPAAPFLLTKWDGKVKAYYPSIAAGPAGQWLVVFGLADGAHVAAAGVLGGRLLQDLESVRAR
jgi:hypothetical protein